MIEEKEAGAVTDCFLQVFFMLNDDLLHMWRFFNQETIPVTFQHHGQLMFSASWTYYKKLLESNYPNYCVVNLPKITFVNTFCRSWGALLYSSPPVLRCLPVEFPQWCYSRGQPPLLATRGRAPRPFSSPSRLLLLPGRPPRCYQAGAVAGRPGPAGGVSVVLGFGGARWLASTEEREEELFARCCGEVLQPGLYQKWYRTVVLRQGRRGRRDGWGRTGRDVKMVWLMDSLWKDERVRICCLIGFS